MNIKVMHIHWKMKWLIDDYSCMQHLCIIATHVHLNFILPFWAKKRREFSNFSIFGNCGSVILNILDIRMNRPCFRRLMLWLIFCWFRIQYYPIQCHSTQKCRNIQQNIILIKPSNYKKCSFKWIDANSIVLHSVSVEFII